jgi:hypothetical protein
MCCLKWARGSCCRIDEKDYSGRNGVNMEALSQHEERKGAIEGTTNVTNSIQHSQAIKSTMYRFAIMLDLGSRSMESNDDGGRGARVISEFIVTTRWGLVKLSH